MTPETLADRPAAEIARALREGRADPVELTETCLARIAAEPSPVFIAVTAARARAEARAAAERLAAGRPLSALDGVPIAWKDLVDMAGERTTAGSATRAEVAPATADAPVVTNAARAGMVSLGKLNLAEFAFSALGQNPHWGTPRNPAAEGRAPGGSSSGSGAAVAGGLAPLALGSDTGGSVRIPASFCGLVGFKTSEGRVPIGATFPLSRTQDTLGPLARTVEDAALVDSVLRGAPGEPAPRAAEPAALALVVPEGAAIAALDEGVGAAFEAALSRLAAAGARVRRVPLPALDRAAAALREIGAIIAAEAFHEHRAVMDGPDAARLDPRVRARIELGRAMSAADLLELQRLRREGMAEVAAALDGALLAMPTTPIPAPPLAETEDDAGFRRATMRANRNTNLGSLMNLPGLAIPCGEAGDAPASLLLSAPGGEDARLLSAGLGLEGAIRG